MCIRDRHQPAAGNGYTGKLRKFCPHPLALLGHLGHEFIGQPVLHKMCIRDRIKGGEQMKRFLTLLLCLTLLVSMAALPATSLAEETVELTDVYKRQLGSQG